MTTTPRPWDDDAPEEVREWFQSRPECVQARIREFPPGERFLMKTTGHVCRLFAYSTTENDTVCDECQVLVLQEDNGGKLHLERRVFGVLFSDLAPLPEGWVPLGDRPLEGLPPEMAKLIEEQQHDETQ